MAQIIPTLAIGDFFRDNPCSLLTYLGFCENLLTFWHCEVLQDHFIFSLPQSRNHFSKETWFLLLQNHIQRPRTVFSECSLLGVVVSRPSQQRELGNICVCTNPCIHTYPEFWISDFRFSLKKREFILIPPIPIQYHGIRCRLLPFLICNFFFIQRESWLSLFTI